jgi:hypothetical protein
MSIGENLIYPIGRFVSLGVLSTQERLAAIDVLASLPEQLSVAVAELSESQLDTPYRVGGWSVRQIVHHLADSDMTAYSWMRLALTEEWPTVYDYDPAALAELADSRLSVNLSLRLLEGLHVRWVATLRCVEDADWCARGYVHPETGRCSLEQALAMYGWHSRHHLAQIWSLGEGLAEDGAVTHTLPSRRTSHFGQGQFELCRDGSHSAHYEPEPDPV